MGRGKSRMSALLFRPTLMVDRIGGEEHIRCISRSRSESTGRPGADSRPAARNSWMILGSLCDSLVDSRFEVPFSFNFRIDCDAEEGVLESNERIGTDTADQ